MKNAFYKKIILVPLMIFAISIAISSCGVKGDIKLDSKIISDQDKLINKLI
tara:strand:+ start:17 stop:169 length:153 start_codon:yes stop_codon:yes gene_type:complete